MSAYSILSHQGAGGRDVAVLRRSKSYNKIQMYNNINNIDKKRICFNININLRAGGGDVAVLRRAGGRVVRRHVLQPADRGLLIAF